MVVDPAVVGAGHGAQLDAAVVGLEGLDLLGAVGGQPILQVDAGERGGELPQIGGRRADLARELTETPVRRSDGLVGAW